MNCNDDSTLLASLTELAIDFETANHRTQLGNHADDMSKLLDEVIQRVRELRKEVLELEDDLKRSRELYQEDTTFLKNKLSHYEQIHGPLPA